jgi:cytochrome c551/c552
MGIEDGSVPESGVAVGGMDCAVLSQAARLRHAGRLEIESSTKRRASMFRSALLASTLAMAVFFAGTAAAAESGADLLKAKGCMNCHDREAKKVGPSFKEIAGKKPDKSALVAKLRDGKGHMKVAASEAEIGQMVEAVLSMK